MTDEQIGDYWDLVSEERRKLIAETRGFCVERRRIIADRQRLLKEYTRLGHQMLESASRLNATRRSPPDRG